MRYTKVQKVAKAGNRYFLSLYLSRSLAHTVSYTLSHPKGGRFKLDSLFRLGAPRYFEAEDGTTDADNEHASSHAD